MAEKQPKTFTMVLKEYGDDTTITRKTIQDRLYDTAVLHSKYAKYLYLWRKALMKAEREKNIQYKQLWNYYTDEFPTKLNASEKKWHIETDESFVPANTKHRNLLNEVQQLDDMCKFCSNISFFTGRIVEWEMFQSGRK